MANAGWRKEITNKIENGNGECVKETTLPKAENSRRPPTGVQYSVKIPQPKA